MQLCTELEAKAADIRASLNQLVSPVKLELSISAAVLAAAVSFSEQKPWSHQDIPVL